MLRLDFDRPDMLFVHVVMPWGVGVLAMTSQSSVEGWRQGQKIALFYPRAMQFMVDQQTGKPMGTRITPVYGISLEQRSVLAEISMVETLGSVDVRDGDAFCEPLQRPLFVQNLFTDYLKALEGYEAALAGLVSPNAGPKIALPGQPMPPNVRPLRP